MIALGWMRHYVGCCVLILQDIIITFLSFATPLPPFFPILGHTAKDLCNGETGIRYNSFQWKLHHISYYEICEAILDSVVVLSML
jgi:hypothetical protein